MGRDYKPVNYELRVCLNCGEKFKPKTKKSKCCSTSCVKTWSRKNETGTCIEENCDRPVRAKNRCASHYTMWQRRETGYERRQTGEHRTDAQRLSDSNKNHLRRLKIRGDESEKINIFEIAQRDGWICQICFQPVDSSLKYPDRMSKSLDHIVLLSHGGDHTYSNVRLTHLVCNLERPKLRT